MLLLAAKGVVSNEMTICDLVLINAFMMQLFMPLNFLGFVYREIKGSLANIERMFELLARKPKVTDSKDAANLQIGKGAIRFNDVKFEYDPSRPILKGISFNINSGEKLAVVGESGSGKSTLVKLLFRFYDVTQGSIEIDGVDIKTFTQQSLRKHMGIVPQDTVLFNDTIFENIRYGNPKADDSEVWQAIKHAHLFDFIQDLPKKEHAIVGERGLKLSGGEKQRVAIARTILKRPPILIFDEATSSLDSGSEQAILKALHEISTGHTSLVIAHRLSTIVDADKIIVMHQGEIVETGDHQQLIAANGRYAKMWAMQQD
jgi:ATP-binding cassette subfamily B protein